MNDPTVEEIRNIREAHAMRFANDLDAIYEDLRRCQAKLDKPLVSLPPVRLVNKKAV